MPSIEKLKDRTILKDIIKKLQSQGKHIVFTNGCFDLIHPGHIRLLKKSKSCGDVLVVALNSDRSIKKIKGKKRPILNQKARAEILSAIRYVDYVVIFDEPTPYKLIKLLRPDVLVKGADWQENNIVGREFVKKVVRVNLIKRYSTSLIIKRIIKKYGR